MRHTLILSDLHLWQLTDHDDMWMRYRHRQFAPDAQLVALVERVYAQIGSDPLELVLNGDIFDFDIPPVIAGHATPAPSPRTGEQASARLAAILDDHELFIAALVRVLSRGDRVVFVSGNHDIQLSLPEVQECLIARIRSRLPAGFFHNPDSRDCESDRLSEQLQFFPWYYQSADGVHIEHGNQYDLYCSVLDPAAPLCPRKQLRPNAGGLLIEHLIGHLGYFNPNVESTFLLTTREYVTHWQTYYKRSKRSLVGTWFFGSLRVVWQLARNYGLSGGSAVHWPRARHARASEPTRCGEREHAALFALPDVRAAMRLLCIDRALLLLVVLASLALALLSVALAVPLFAVMIALLYCLRSRAPASDLDEVSAHVDKSARAIARIYGARAVVFGHTHKASGVWAGGVFFGNSGTWAPMYHDIACTIPVETSRPLLWLRTDDQSLSGGLYRFHDGELHPDPGSQKDPSHPGLSAELVLAPLSGAPALRFASLPGTGPDGSGASEQNRLG
jgi:UDP-2,3-diacylglucosamine pyrophosphatase LpxH